MELDPLRLSDNLRWNLGWCGEEDWLVLVVMAIMVVKKSLRKRKWSASFHTKTPSPFFI
jgi:hypothetical protein